LRSLSRYIKEHYKRVYIKRELYEKLRELASKEGVTVPGLIARMYERYIQHNIMPNIQPNISPNTAVSRDISPNIMPNIAGDSDIRHNIQHNIMPNIQPNTQPPTPRASEKGRSGHVWCRKRASIRNLDAFINWVKKTYGLIDWWESEGEICFETLEPPERGKKSKRRGPEEGELEGEELE
jgi:hypothetical protein